MVGGITLIVAGVIFVVLGRFYRADRPKEQALVKPLGESDSAWDSWYRRTSGFTIIFGFVLITVGLVGLVLVFLAAIGWISELPSFFEGADSNPTTTP